MTTETVANTPILWAADGRSVFIGVRHGQRLQLLAPAAQSIRHIGQLHGFFYEGNGADRAAAERALGPILWISSWDQMVTPRRRSDFYYALFSNGGPSRARMIDRLERPGQTILDSLVVSGDAIAHEALHGADHRDGVAHFLAHCRGSLLEFARQHEATPSAVRHFIARGERLMWPDGGQETAASQVAKRANQDRLQAIAGKPGAFFLGSDLIPVLHSVSPKLQRQPRRA